MTERDINIESTHESGVPLWKDIIEAPGFSESWERAREQARRGEQVPPSEVERLLNEE